MDINTLLVVLTMAVAFSIVARTVVPIWTTVENHATIGDDDKEIVQELKMGKLGRGDILIVNYGGEKSFTCVILNNEPQRRRVSFACITESRITDFEESGGRVFDFEDSKLFPSTTEYCVMNRPGFYYQYRKTSYFRITISISQEKRDFGYQRKSPKVKT